MDLVDTRQKVVYVKDAGIDPPCPFGFTQVKLYPLRDEAARYFFLEMNQALSVFWNDGDNGNVYLTKILYKTDPSSLEGQMSEAKRQKFAGY